VLYFPLENTDCRKSNVEPSTDPEESHLKYVKTSDRINVKAWENHTGALHKGIASLKPIPAVHTLKD
jgi:hypothetical protein